MQHEEQHLEHTEAPADIKKQIWRTFWILFALTIIDILIYFYTSKSTMKTMTFIGLGVVKAFFIVNIFMHMKFERKWLPYIIITPMLFVLYLITLMILEGNYTSFVR